MSDLPEDPYIPLARLIDLLHAPDFLWSCPGLGATELKYMEVRIDTRDLGCFVRDRHGKHVDLADLEKRLSTNHIAEMFRGMNENEVLSLQPAGAAEKLRQMSSAVWRLLHGNPEDKAAAIEELATLVEPATPATDAIN